MPDAPLNTKLSLALMDGDTKTVTAAYWVIDNDIRWMEFKDANHKVVFAIREDRVNFVERLSNG